MQEPNLFVRNISYKATDQDLETLFGEVGQVMKAKIIMDRETDRSRGFGFVEMSSIEEAERAIQELDGAELVDRPINVSYAKPRERR